MPIATSTALALAGGALAAGVVGPKLFGGAKAPPPPPPPAAPEPLPQRTDPEVDRARREQERAELQRRGRRASILAGDNPDGLGTISRPEGRSAQNLGNVGQG